MEVFDKKRSAPLVNKNDKGMQPDFAETPAAIGRVGAWVAESHLFEVQKEEQEGFEWNRQKLYMSLWEMWQKLRLGCEFESAH